jgi:hypothetical protein
MVLSAQTSFIEVASLQYLARSARHPLVAGGRFGRAFRYFSLKIKARVRQQAGFRFFKSNNGV